MTELRCAVEQRENDLSWTILQRDQRLLQLYGLRVADGVMDLVACQHRSMTPDRKQEAANRLLTEVIRSADEHQLHELRCLQTGDSPVLPEAALKQQGFHPAVILQSWTSVESSSVGLDQSITQQTLSEALTQFGRRQTTSLTAACLDDSRDLQSLSQPDPDYLLQSWERLDEPQLFLARRQNRLCGLAVLTYPTDDDVIQAPVLQYLGVARAHRREGWGRRILRQVCSAATGLVAWCDTENTPAMRLYGSSGFASGERQTIYARSGACSQPAVES